MSVCWKRSVFEKVVPKLRGDCDDARRNRGTHHYASREYGVPVARRSRFLVFNPVRKKLGVLHRTTLGDINLRRGHPS